MDDEILQKYIRAGKIAAEVREKAHSIVAVGTPLLEIAEKIENMIKFEGAELSFPVNISINDTAAHYTPPKNESAVVGENDIIKLDMGAHIDGYVTDTAITINFNPDYEDLVKATEHALHEAIKLVRPGVLLSDISEAIEETIKNIGYKPISNLTGHGVGRYDLHTEPSVPNVAFKSDYRLKEDQIIAIEPFATDGTGYVKDSENTFIFSIFEPKPVRSPDARSVISMFSQRNGLPFAERWIELGSLFKTRLALRELRERGILHDYHVLKEAGGGMVSQAEHTVIVRDKPMVITK